MKTSFEPISAEEENSSETPISPVRRLMAAMLERAIRDLMTGSTVEIISALRWFKSERTKCVGHIPFLLVVETLELGQFYLVKINDMVVEAEARHGKLRELQGEDRKKRGLYVTNSQHTKINKGGRRVPKFRRYIATLKG
jgi:hypothetical protein